MLAPLGESKEDSPFVPLAVKALRVWPSFVETLQAEIDTPLKINGPGMLRIALNDSEVEELCRTYEWQKTFGLPLTMLSPKDLRLLEPSLSHTILRAILTPMELHIEPRLLVTALQEALIKRGAKLVNSKVLGFSVHEKKVIGVNTAEETYTADKYIVANGAWSRPLVQQLGRELPIYPVRGQIVSYLPITPRPLARTIYSHIGYLVPRPDGTLLAGATTERVGFDSNTTDEGIESLKTMASSLLPITEGQPYTTWAGLRPVSDDAMALIGDLPGWEGVFLATGHGRNGVLLAPYTGQLVADHLLNGVHIPSTFAPARFGAAS
jgi:glycine oxidase